MARRGNRNATLRITLSALLLGMMLILGYIESLFPVGAGIPGVKLGLSNGVLIFAVYMLDIPTGFTLMALKVLLSGILFAGPSMMMYGFAGGLLSLTGMALLSQIKKLPPTAVSVAGGILHNIGQVGMSLIILQTPFRAMLWYMLALTAIGAICGFLTGVCATMVMKHLRSAGWKVARDSRRDRRMWIIAIAVIAFAGAVCAWYLMRAPGRGSDTQVEWEMNPVQESLPAPLSGEREENRLVDAG